MKCQAPVNLEGTSGPRARDGAPDSAHFCDFSPRDEHALPWLQGRRRKTNKQKAWASVFSALAVLGMLVSCIRAVQVRAFVAGAGRKLASGGNEKDHEQAAILELCLDLQEETGVITQRAAPLPGPTEAIPVILESLEFSQAAGPQQIVQSRFAPLESAAPTFTSEPGPSHVVAAGWGAGHMQAWDHSVQTAEYGVLPQVEAEGVAGPSTAPSQPFREIALQDTPVTPYQPPVVHISATAPHLLSPGVPSSRGKRGITGPEGGRPGDTAKQTKVEGASQQPGANKQTSGCKRRAPFSLPVFFPPVHQHDSQEAAAEVSNENPVSHAMQALRAIWSPEPWDSSETAGDASPPTRPEEEDRYTSPVQTMPHSLQQPESHLYPLKEPPSAELRSPASPASADSSLPSTSIRLGRPWDAPPESPLPALSRPALTETSPPSALPSGDDRSLEQISITEPLTRSDQLPLASHRFYRLPTLLPGRIPKRFDPAKAFTVANSRARPLFSLALIRCLLARPEITAQDAATLVACSEALAGRLYHELQVPLNDVKMSKVVEHLGRAFFALDALLSVIKVVGPAMDAQSWWPKLASVIPQQTSFPVKLQARAETVCNARLAARLSAALQSLKSGQRLAAEETVQLKRELLSKALAVPEFRDKKWDPWREDDEGSDGSTGS